MKKNINTVFKSTILSSLILFNASAAKNGGEIKIASLKKAWESAYNTNPELLSSVKDQRATSAAVAKAHAGFRPNLSLSLDVERKNIDSYNLPETNPSSNPFKGSRTSTIITPSIVLTQSLFQFGKSFDEVDAAQHQAYASWGKYFALENSILTKSAEAYLNVKANKEIVKINEKTLNFSKQVLKSVKIQAEVGEKTMTDVDQALARVEEAKAGLSTAKANHKTAIANFVNVVGFNPADNLKDVVWNFKNSTPKSLNSFKAAILKNNPELIAAKHNEKAAQKSYIASAKGLLPNLNATLSAQKVYEDWVRDTNNPTTAGGENNIVSGKISLSVPLYQGGAVHADTRKGFYLFKKARLDYKNTESSVIESATKLWENLNSLKEKLSFLKAQIKFLKRSLDGTKKEADLGAKTILDVLQVEDKLLKARTDLVNAEKDYKITVFKMMAIEGRLTHDNLKLNVTSHKVKETHKKDYRRFFGIGE